jgi:hypothetical protein
MGRVEERLGGEVSWGRKTEVARRGKIGREE